VVLCVLGVERLDAVTNLLGRGLNDAGQLGIGQRFIAGE
jgi:hypothetical protein